MQEVQIPFDEAAMNVLVATKIFGWRWAGRQMSSDGYWVDPEGTRLDIEVPDFATNKESAREVVEYMSHLGWDLEVQRRDPFSNSSFLVFLRNRNTGQRSVGVGITNDPNGEEFLAEAVCHAACSVLGIKDTRTQYQF